MRQVNFLIAGVQKAGTSSLYQMLKRHPAVGLSSVKEVHFFDDERVDWSRPDYDRYHSHFPRRKGAMTYGEATPIYSYWPHALERIKAYAPKMKLILLFRDPIARTYSAWSHQRRRGRETLSFAEAIRARPGERAHDASFGNRHFTYVERGFYGEQLARCLALFPRGNVLTLDCAQLSRDPTGLLHRVTSFLGIAMPNGPAEAIQANVRPQGRNEDPPSPADISLLTEKFAPDLARFAELIDFPIADWPTVRLIERRMSAEDVARRFAPADRNLAKQGRVLPVLHPIVSGAAIATKRVAAMLRRYARRIMP